MAPTEPPGASAGRPGGHASEGTDRWQQGWWSAARPCPSPNAGERPEGCLPSLLVLHSISLPPGQYGGPQIEQLFCNALDWSAHPYFETIRGLQVSAHFLIRREGELLQFVSCDRRAWHAGASRWRGRDNCNDWSIGVELEGLEGERFEPAQYQALSRLAAAIAPQYPVHEVIGHQHIAPGRKQDPGSGFDWPALLREPGWPGQLRADRAVLAASTGGQASAALASDAGTPQRGA